MRSEVVLMRWAKVFPEAIDNSSGRLRVSAEKLVEEFGRLISYEEIMAILPFFSQREKEIIKEGIARKQQEFWNSPQMTSYYAKDHPRLPPVPSHFRSLLRAIDPGKGEIIVDLGCGMGALIQRILEAEPGVERVIGIDYASGMLDQYREGDRNGRVVLINNDLTKGIPLQPGTVDKCISNWGISYFPTESLQRVVDEIHQVLKPGGYFICAAIVKGANLARLRRIFSLPQALRNWGLIKKATQFAKNLEMYFPSYSVRELRDILERGNFVIESFHLTLDGGSITLVARKVS